MFDNSKGHTSGGGCYLTTLTCEMLDLPDDDHCLETMRWYRDNVMMNLEKILILLLFTLMTRK